MSETAAITRRELSRRAREAKRRRARKRALSLVAAVLIGAVLSVGLRVFVFRSFYVPSESMVPTLSVGDRIIVDEISPALGGYHRGDIVVFSDPDDWMSGGGQAQWWELLLPWPDSGQYLVKRIIALPGDTVVGRADGTILVNGVVLDEEYAVAAGQDPFAVTLEADEVWVMGDNRANSSDSRFHGALDESSLVGRAVLVYWPLNAVGTLG